jgi:hypothetical protein
MPKHAILPFLFPANLEYPNATISVLALGCNTCPMPSDHWRLQRRKYLKGIDRKEKVLPQKWS